MAPRARVAATPSLSLALLLLPLLRPAAALVAPRAAHTVVPSVASRSALLAASEAPDVEPALEIPVNLPSDAGIDYVPLATALFTGDFRTADDLTRSLLITLAGDAAVERGYVYWTEVHSIPAADLSTIEKLWLRSSEGRFGYSVQRRVFNLEREDFEAFCRRIGWNTMEGDIERKRRWYGKSEFIYDVKAPVGHLPLTSALRGTQLFRRLMTHPVWEAADWSDWKSLEL